MASRRALSVVSDGSRKSRSTSGAPPPARLCRPDIRIGRARAGQSALLLRRGSPPRCAGTSHCTRRSGYCTRQPAETETSRKASASGAPGEDRRSIRNFTTVGKAQKQPLHLTPGYSLPDHKALGSSPFQSTGHGSSSNVRSPCSGWTDRDVLEHAIRLGDILVVSP